VLLLAASTVAPLRRIAMEPELLHSPC